LLRLCKKKREEAGAQGLLSFLGERKVARKVQRIVVYSGKSLMWGKKYLRKKKKQHNGGGRKEGKALGPHKVKKKI